MLPDSGEAGGTAPTAIFGTEEGAAWEVLAQSLLGLSGGEGDPPPAGVAAESRLTAPMLALSQASTIRYPRRADVPDGLRSERLPPVSADFEAQLATYVDFSDAVLASRLRTRVQLARTDTDLFSAAGVQEIGRAHV